jgi:hypothetical protein
MVSQYQHFVFESTAQTLEDEHTAEVRREREAKQRRAAIWMFNINPERLAREGQIILDASETRSTSSRNGNGLADSGSSARTLSSSRAE